MAKKSGKKAAPKRTAANTVSKKKAAPAKNSSRPKTVSRPVKPRRLKQPKYKTLRLQKRIKHPVQLPNVWRLTRKSALTLWEHKRLFIGITLVYGLLNIILTQGLSGTTDVSTLKHSISQVFTGHLGGLASGISVFALLVGSAGNNSSPTAGAYQFFLGLIASLAIIWALRQVLAGASGLRIRDTYYKGMYPLVPFIIVLLVIGLQLIPLLIGSAVYGLIINNGIAVYFVEKFLWELLYGLLALLSIYMISSSLFALYIVTLPNMTPLKALRSARELVRYRRWTVIRKVLWLPIVLLIAGAIVMVPIIMWLTPLAKWVFFLLTMAGLTGVHAYMYTLYRELLNE
ncbi:MAG TPA: hypothetical protein VFC50_01190 [Candidatus Dormibacteraeota bacterium]|nr:hypothetical protein [Candidatus Dormibacteraeota bacterium]